MSYCICVLCFPMNCMIFLLSYFLLEHCVFSLQFPFDNIVLLYFYCQFFWFLRSYSHFTFFVIIWLSCVHTLCTQSVFINKIYLLLIKNIFLLCNCWHENMLRSFTLVHHPLVHMFMWWRLGVLLDMYILKRVWDIHMG